MQEDEYDGNFASEAGYVFVIVEAFNWSHNATVYDGNGLVTSCNCVLCSSLLNFSAMLGSIFICPFTCFFCCFRKSFYFLFSFVQQFLIGKNFFCENFLLWLSNASIIRDDNSLQIVLAVWKIWESYSNWYLQNKIYDIDSLISIYLNKNSVILELQ